MQRDFLLVFTLTAFLIFNSFSLSPICSACHTVVHQIQKRVPQKPFNYIYESIGVQVCSYKKIQDHSVCKGAVDEMIDSIVNSVWHKLMDPHSVCHNLFLCPKEYFKRNITQELERIIKQKPNKSWEKATGRKTIRMMHISDLHTDFFYSEGAEANCGQPLCCRQGIKNNKSLREQVKKPAGYWGSLASCDLPPQTFDLFLNEIKKLNLDFIIWTGDNTAHDIWSQSQSYNLNFTTILTAKIKNATNITVLPAMGNHESYPVNVYDYGSDREDTLKHSLAESWRSWIGEKAYQMLKTKGYYSVVLPQHRNLKVISLNTQAGNDQNWYLMKNPTDPGNMLQWLELQLLQCQKQNQFAYIIGHIPPSSNLNSWSLRYDAIVDRFSYTIRGQFYGHTHQDHLGFHYSLKNKSQISNYQFIAPSLTTYSNIVPRYRILDVDFDTLQVKDYHQYRLDLRKYHKKEDNPQFELLYSFKQTYGVQDLRPQNGMKDFVNKLKTDPETQKKYTYYHTGGLGAGRTGTSSYCESFALPQLVVECSGEKYKSPLIEKVAGEWKDLKHKQN